MSDKFKKKRLSEQQLAFVEAYNGSNGTQAALIAGYSTKSTHATACRLLNNPRIQEEIKKRIHEPLECDKIVKEEQKLRIATREQRKAFWTSVIEDPESKMSDKLKASELLAKSECDFINKTEITGDSKITIVRKDYTKPQLKSVA